MKYSKIILTANLDGLVDNALLDEIRAYNERYKKFPTYVPNLSPGTGVMDNHLTMMDGLYINRNLIESMHKANTLQIQTGLAYGKDIIVSQWMPQASLALGGDKNKITDLGHGIKGESQLTPIVKGSAPVASRVDNNISGRHIIYFINNLTKKVALPDWISRIDVYGQTGGTRPTSLAQLIANGGGYLGEATRGVFENILPAGNVGKYEYYIGVYIDKQTKKPWSYSVVFEAVIT